MVVNSVRLQLMIGATIPLPAPYAVVDALVSIEVTNRDEERDGFQMTFSLGKDSLLDYGLLFSGILDPPNRVIITVIIGVLPQVLIDGIITNHQFLPSNQPGESRLIVTGEDISLKLDLEEKNATYPNQPDSVIITRLVASYATLGLIPKVTPTTDIPIQIDRIPTQQGTDLNYIQQLARHNSFVFYIEPIAPGVNTAYWGIDNRLGLPQPALTMNMGANTNVDTPITFNFNALGPAQPQVTIVEPFTKLAIPIPVPSGLRPPLASKPAMPLRKTLPRNTANLNPTQAALRAVSSASQSSDALTATGEVDTVRYGRALRSRRLVGVRGVGFNYDGIYYVKQVTHRIERGKYKQSFTLTREGRGALTPAVVP
ncbi:phage late control D family protein [Iningainema tapete]|uniref:Phage protein D n=1 Tax=Iningainema tapete BLCC-T55 TaxID=2748662 RepID=A0A8J7C7L5_9CYAN|nr:hypothetical protein [Iningainema tapete]MBD2773371.1 hypothetical protein [Iningainema tapete BLCC-T55]